MTAHPERLVWVDCEMTGLDLEHDVLVEIAALVTDDELNILDEGIQLVIQASEEQLAAMPDVVRQMHSASGLLGEIPSGIPVREAEQAVLEFVRRHVPEARKAPLAGNSIATDRSFLVRHMSELDDYLHYRMVDVSSIKELVRRWYPRVYFASPEKGRTHRALTDIRESIAELRYYRSTIFVPQPGPSTDEAKAAAHGILTG